MQQTMITLIVERVGTIIFCYLSPQDLLLFSRTSRKAQKAVAEYFRRAYDINASLSRFFLDPCGFRSLQARTGALVSGSFALQFFDRTFYPNSDLDIYVHSLYRREVGRWLMTMGYTFSPSRWQDSSFETAVLSPYSARGLHYVMPGVLSIFTFHRRAFGESLKVQIIVARKAPMEVVLGFHSTCVMNIISYNTAYCLFPRATLEERRSLLSWSSQGRSKRRAEGLIKYAARGFRMLESVDADELSALKPRSSFTFGPRWLGDPYTWIIPLDTQGVLPPPPPNQFSTARSQDPVALSSFTVRYDSLDGAIMDFSVVQSPALMFPYVMSPGDVRDHVGWDMRLRTNAELHKVEVCALEDWQYWDSELPSICAHYLSGAISRMASSLGGV